MSGKRTFSVGGGAVAIVTLLALAPAAFAGTIRLSRACYVSPKIGEGSTITVSGSGFAPGEAVFAQIPAPVGLMASTEVTVGSQGSFVASLPNVSPESIDPVADKETMQIRGVLSEAILAEAPFELTNLAVKLSPASAKPAQKVTYSFSGFAPGKAIYAHYLHRGKVVLTYKFGKTAGACGTLKAKSRIYPGKSRYSSYKIQFDDSKKYSKDASPKIDTSISILRF